MFPNDRLLEKVSSSRGPGGSHGALIKAPYARPSVVTYNKPENVNVNIDEVISMAAVAAEPLAEPDVDDVMAKLLREMQEKEDEDLGAAYPNHVGQDDEAGR